jgi:hypothetical protein
MFNHEKLYLEKRRQDLQTSTLAMILIMILPLFALCALREDVSYILFNCPPAQFYWSFMHELLTVDWSPSSFAIFQPYRRAARRLLWTIFAAQSWALRLQGTNLLSRLNSRNCVLTVFLKLLCFCCFGCLCKIQR